MTAAKYVPGNAYQKVYTELINNAGNVIDSTNPLPVSSTNQKHENMEGLGKNAIGTTATAITFTGVTESIIISADIANTGLLYIGKSNVLTDGSNAIAFLEAGDNITLDYEDSTNAIYVVASAAAQNYWAGCLL